MGAARRAVIVALLLMSARAAEATPALTVVGYAATSAAGASLSIADVTIAPGDSVIVVVGTPTDADGVRVFDGDLYGSVPSNQYVTDLDTGNAGYSNGGQRVVILSKHAHPGMAHRQMRVKTGNYAAGSCREAVVLDVSGVARTDWPDRFAWAVGPSTTAPDTGAAPITGTAGELVFAAFTLATNTAPTLPGGSPYTPISYAQPTCASGTRKLALFYRVAAGADATGAALNALSAGWAGITTRYLPPP